MSLSRNFDNIEEYRSRGPRSHSAQGLAQNVSSPAMKIPLPPRMWITDIEAESSDEGDSNDQGVTTERPRVRSRFRHHKLKPSSVPIGIFWDIENCQIPRGCSAIDVVAAIRNKFLNGRREADFVVVCDVRKEDTYRLDELNDAQISLIHVCGTQKNAADEKLRQCMRRFSELHNVPAALLLISGDINFAADLSDFRHRKNMEVILVHKENTSPALIACATSHHCYHQLTALLPKNGKVHHTTDYLAALTTFLNAKYSFIAPKNDEDLTCILVVWNLPYNQPNEKIRGRLRRLADNCGGRVLRIASSIATVRFPTPIQAARALKRMDGEDVFGRKIHTRYMRGIEPPTYSSDEGYNTAPPTIPQRPTPPPTLPQRPPSTPLTQQILQELPPVENIAAQEWAHALHQLPTFTPPPLDFCPPAAPKPRKIRGTHGSVNLDRSGCSSSMSGDDSRLRAASPWNSSSVSEQSEAEDSSAELTITNLPPYEPAALQEMITQLLSQYVPVVRVSVWAACDGPLGSVVLRSEHDARLAIARVHKRRLDQQWTGRRLELSLGRPSPAPNLDVLRARLRAILLDHKGHALPLLRLRDAYASRHCCALTTSDIAKVKDTVIIHEGFGRMVQLLDLTPVTNSEMEEAPWKCHIHASLSMIQEDGSRILQPVFMEVAVLAQHANVLLENHGGLLPLLSFMECYEATFPPLFPDPRRGVPLELLLRSAPGLDIKDTPSRHLTWRTEGPDSPPSFCSQSESSRSSGHSDRPRTAPALEPMLALFERELIDLLRTAPKCSIPFSKLIPAFHHHFGRQCRVADYGFTKLPDLLSALGNTIVVLGSGSSRVITISCSAQGRRWTSDLVKLLKTQPGRAILMHDIPQLFQTTYGRMFTPVDYGVCTLPELMERVSPQAISVAADGTISLPRRAPTEEEKARTVQFSQQTVELLCYTPNLRMEFSRFVPAYHAHFGRQLRVAHYGCVKLIDLFELIPDAVSVSAEINGERAVKLSARTAKPVIAQRLRSLGTGPIQTLPLTYARQFGAPPLPDILEVSSLKELVYAAGGYIENGMVVPPGRLASVALSACAALCGDRSVARGSTHEYFNITYRRFTATSPDLLQLAAGGIIRIEDSRVILMPAWRTVWRLAQIFADKAIPMTAMEVYMEYTNRFEPVFPGAETGLEGVSEFLRQYNEIFADTGNGRWTLCGDVVVPRVRDIPIVQEDYSVHDTPPGQKGSRVFESPKHNIWCSPPASALPVPTAFLTQEKRRTRLAAQFGAL